MTGHTDHVRDPLLDPPSWAPSWLPTVDDVRGARLLRWLVTAVFVAGVAACVTEGANSPADPELGTVAPETSATAPDGDGLAERFGTVAAQLVGLSGEVLELCLLHADTAEERSTGLMQVTDLEGHDGMLFSMEEARTGSFYMYRTLLPLTIGWWDAEGAFVSRAEMVPCESEDPAACERYPAAGPYRHAIEVVKGDPLADRFEAGVRLQVGTEGCAVPA